MAHKGEEGGGEIEDLLRAPGRRAWVGLGINAAGIVRREAGVNGSHVDELVMVSAHGGGGAAVGRARGRPFDFLCIFSPQVAVYG